MKITYLLTASLFTLAMILGSVQAPAAKPGKPQSTPPGHTTVAKSRGDYAGPQEALDALEAWCDVQSGPVWRQLT
jgi:hypothetical protein